MDLPHYPGHLEAKHLSLSAKQFPLEVTLKPRVVERFADDPDTPADSSTLERGQLLKRLQQWSDLEDCPLDAILAQGQACGDATAPSRDQVAVLRWVGAAHSQWEQDYPLENELIERLRQLKPLLAAIAISDPVFLTPGKHPLHTLLDSVQAAAIGWQASLGRAAQALEQQIDEAVERVLRWFDQPEADLQAIVSELESKLARDGERARKMARRVIEMELGRQQKTEARITAATMINAALEKYKSPADIAEMLKGPWYDSAQLVLLKFGTDSEQWTKMSKATDTLLDSVQILEDEPDGRRQHLFRAVTLLPKELKRWLLSLQHDTGAVDDAVGLVEFAHLCVLRQSPLETESIPPLPLPEGVLEEEGEEEDQTESDAAQVGQWYWILREGEAPLRARIIFDLKSERKLLFANRAGMEVLRLGREEFSNLVDKGCAMVLQRGASYSRALAAAAGITCEEDLQGLPKAASTEALATDSPAPEGQGAATLSEEEEQARLWREWEEARARQQGPGTESQANETG